METKSQTLTTKCCSRIKLDDFMKPYLSQEKASFK